MEVSVSPEFVNGGVVVSSPCACYVPFGTIQVIESPSQQAELTFIKETKRID
ncbi:hypothetical protein SAMN05216270_105267 [Glycomyces harbinensis]|uniref:Uncharacterized protein n=1 Tax=Glycomyces harbinensis TaxID=58114 RepID=A0A1G6W2F7_9ACTN|nr:hypothetical protein SAMN05216270_105267 [Glycomyces harbinensis]